jgi:hypothetical protein
MLVKHCPQASPMKRLCWLLLAVALVGCAAKGKEVLILSSPYADEAEHMEPVFFTGHHYEVTFRFSRARLAYATRVAGQGWEMTRSPDHQSTAEQVAKSALSHFACPTKQHAGIVKDTAVYGEGVWRMEVRCSG